MNHERVGPTDGGPDRSTSRSSSWLRSNQGAAAVMLVGLTALLGWLLASPSSFRQMRDGFPIGFFPILSILLMIACCVVMLFDARRSEPFREASQLGGVVDFRAVIYAIGALGAIYLYFHGVLVIGYPILTPFFLFALTHLLGLRPLWLNIATALVITAFVYVAFLVLGIRLPAGTLF